MKKKLYRRRNKVGRVFYHGRFTWEGRSDGDNILLLTTTNHNKQNDSEWNSSGIYFFTNNFVYYIVSIDSMDSSRLCQWNDGRVLHTTQ